MGGKIPFRGAHEPWAFSLNLRNHFCGDLEGFGGLRGERIRRVSWDRDAWVVEGGQFHGLEGMGGHQGVWSPVAEVLWCRGGLAPEIQHRAGVMDSGEEERCAKRRTR